MKKTVFVSTASLIFISILLVSPAAAKLRDFGEDSDGCDCFRGKPLGECRTYWVLETGFMSRVKENEYSSEYQSAFVANFGRMHNLTKKSALGGTVSFIADDEGLSIGLGPRYRYWVSSRIGLDISPHLIFANTSNSSMKGLGYQINASIAIGELFSINGHYRNVEYKTDVILMPQQIGYNIRVPDKRDEGFYLGFSGRSYATPVAPAVYFLFLILFRDIGKPVGTPYF